MSKLELIVRICLLAITVLIALYLTINKIVIKIKSGKKITVETVGEIFSENLTLVNNVKDKLLDYMIVAEEKFKTMIVNGNKTEISKMKESDVLTQIKLDCLTAKIPYDETYWKEEIAKLCKKTKKIN